jgi:hypothetical protein
MTNSAGQVSLSDDQITRIDARLEKTNFDSVQEYVDYVLDNVLYHLEEELDDDFKKANEEEVKSRLQSLGYLDE